MKLPPDPRCFAAPNGDPFVEAALAMAVPSAAVQSSGGAHGPLATLTRHYADALDAGKEAALRAALTAAPSPDMWRTMAAGLDRAIAPDTGAVGARLFAIPIAIIAAGAGGARISAVLPNVQRLGEVLRENRALGPLANFGLSNALSAPAALAALSWKDARAFALAAGQVDLDGSWSELPPEDLVLNGGEEQVHLRFLMGAAVTPPGAPTFLETASAIATWGVPFTRELSAQLQVDGVSVVAIPRPPASLLAAQAVGCAAAEALSLQAFVSRELRRFRSEVGEPDVSLAALTEGALGLRFASPFVENRVFVHVRRLHPSEAWHEVLREVVQLLEECHIEDLRVEAHPMGLAQLRDGTGAPD
jgi:hypothetical protein